MSDEDDFIVISTKVNDERPPMPLLYLALKKLVWFVAAVVLASHAVNICIANWRSWEEFPLVEEIEFMEMEDIEFPAVSVCASQPNPNVAIVNIINRIAPEEIEALLPKTLEFVKKQMVGKSVTFDLDQKELEVWIQDLIEDAGNPPSDLDKIEIWTYHVERVLNGDCVDKFCKFFNASIEFMENMSNSSDYQAWSEAESADVTLDDFYGKLVLHFVANRLEVDAPHEQRLTRFHEYLNENDFEDAIPNWPSVRGKRQDVVHTTSKPSECYITRTRLPCIFPFRYGGKTYYDCTDTDQSFFWCATKVNSEGFMVTSGNCDSSNKCFPSKANSLSATTTVNYDEICPTTNFGKCTFPFIYEDQMYFKCTKDDSLFYWCATETNSKYELLLSSYCKFPNLKSCQVDPNNDTTWEQKTTINVATTTTRAWYDFVKVETYDVFKSGSEFPGCETETIGVPCIFPFSYNDKIFTACTVEGDDRHWCAVSRYPDGKYKEYGYCSSSCEVDNGRPLVKENNGGCFTTNGELCIFPFEYKGKQYNGCTLAFDNNYWCPTNIVGGKILSHGYCSNDCKDPGNILKDSSEVSSITSEEYISLLTSCLELAKKGRIILELVERDGQCWNSTTIPWKYVASVLSSQTPLTPKISKLLAWEHSLVGLLNNNFPQIYMLKGKYSISDIDIPNRDNFAGCPLSKPVKFYRDTVEKTISGLERKLRTAILPLNDLERKIRLPLRIYSAYKTINEKVPDAKTAMKALARYILVGNKDDLPKEIRDEIEAFHLEFSRILKTIPLERMIINATTILAPSEAKSKHLYFSSLVNSPSFSNIMDYSCNKVKTNGLDICQIQSYLSKISMTQMFELTRSLFGPLATQQVTFAAVGAAANATKRSAIHMDTMHVPFCVSQLKRFLPQTNVRPESVRHCEELELRPSLSFPCLTFNSKRLDQILAPYHWRDVYMSAFSLQSSSFEEDSPQQFYGFHFVFDTLKNFLTADKSTNSFWIKIHNRDEIPLFFDYDKTSWMEIRKESSDLITSVPLRVKMALTEYDPEIRSIPLSKRRCIFPDEEPETEHFAVYTVGNCLAECYWKIAEEMCGCRPFNIPSTKIEAICFDHSLMCFEFHVWRLKEDEAKGIVHCKCPPTCSGWSYKIDRHTNRKIQEKIVPVCGKSLDASDGLCMASERPTEAKFATVVTSNVSCTNCKQTSSGESTFPWTSLADYLMINMATKLEVNVWKYLAELQYGDEQMLQRMGNIFKVSVSMDSGREPVLKTIRKLRMTWLDKLSWIGGTMKIFTGINILTCLEAALCLMLLIVKWRKRNHVHELKPATRLIQCDCKQRLEEFTREKEEAIALIQDSRARNDVLAKMLSDTASAGFDMLFGADEDCIKKTTDYEQEIQ